MPGVAIAISLVPPLTVVGLTLESGSTSQASGALLLFTANVTAILAMGALVMAVYRVSAHAPDGSRTGAHVAQVVVVLVVLVAVPLAATSQRVSTTELRERDVRSTADAWTAAAGWEVVSVATDGGSVVVRVAGPLPEPDPDGLRRALDRAGLDDVSVDLEQVPITTTHL